MERLSPVELRAPGEWQIATVTEIKRETPSVKSFRFRVPMWMEHLPGQHYDVRLTAPDGYHAQRSYSIASSPLDVGEIELTIDLLDDGEVSPYFHEVVEVGDEVELRGPFTSYFVWRGESPVVLVGGGSGVVPLMCMLRHKRRTMPELDMRLVYSVRHADDVIYADEIGDDAALTYTRDAPAGGPVIQGTSTRACCVARPRARGSRSCAGRTGSSRRPATCCWRWGWSRARSAPSATGTRAPTPRRRPSRPRCRAPRPRRR